jgi:hypothetical protein
MRVATTTAGIRRLQDKALRRAKFMAGGGMSIVLEPMARDMVQRMFNTAVTFSPGQVKDLNPGYRKLKQKKHGHAYPILHATGTMLKSMYGQALRRGDVWVIQVGFKGQHPSGASNAAMAAAHIEGRGGLPPRDFTKLPPGWERQWLRKISSLLRAIQ